MNDEQLSALMDDQLPAGETRQAVDDLLAEPAARATWRRYHLLGDALRAHAELPATGTARSPSDNVVPFPRPERKSLPRTGLGLAAAAALAAVALIIAAPGPQQATAPQGLAMTAGGGQPTVTPPPTALSNERVAVSDLPRGAEPFAPISVTVSQTGMIKEDEAQKRMNTYLINFNEQRARQRTPGVHPYVRIVGYDTP